MKLFSNLYIYIPPIMVAENRPLNEGRWERGMNSHFFWNRNLPGMLFWKFDFVSFPKRSKLFLVSFGIAIIALGVLVVLRLLEKTKNCESKNWVFSFLLISPSETLPQAEGNYPFHPNSILWKSIFPPPERGEDYGAEKTTKIKLVTILVTTFDKFHHLCNLYIFDFCFVVP